MTKKKPAPTDKTFFPQYQRVANTLRSRILSGDYSLKPFPSERRLAVELGTNYMTVRQGLQILERENILVRQDNRRLTVKRARHGSKPYLNFAFLAPTFNSNNIEFWRMIISRQTKGLPCNVRPVLYMHWDDSILLDALKGFDGIFLNTVPEPLPPNIIELLSQREHPIVVLDEDYSIYGLPSIQLFKSAFVHKLLDHLEACGHKKIGCLSTQPASGEIGERINQWRYWLAARGSAGRLANHPVETHTSPMLRAYHVMDKILAAGSVAETAWFCTTTPAAMGAMRAMLNHGIQPGKGMAICSMHGEELAAMCNPPLTSLETADPSPFVSICLNWMMRGGKEWEGPLLMTPADVPLIVRDSTKPGAGCGIPV